MRRCFVVDPIDGTRGFIKGEDSWSVSLAVVEDGVAVAGVVFAPARDEMYEAHIGGGALCNGRPLMRRTVPGRQSRDAGACCKAKARSRGRCQASDGLPSVAPLTTANSKPGWTSSALRSA